MSLDAYLGFGAAKASSEKWSHDFSTLGVDYYRTAFTWGSEGHSLVSWSSSQSWNTSTLSSGHSFSGCFFLHLGQNMLSVISSTTCLCFSLRTSISKEMELIIYVLKFSRRLPISAWVAPPLDDFCVLSKASRSNLSHLLVLEDPLEYLLHNSIIFLKDSFEISPFPSRFNILK